MSAAEGRVLDALLARRLAGEPMAYLLGEREFWGRSFRVDRRVLVPRPETEHLVEAVLDLVPRRGDGLRLLDVGTGSGIVAVTLALEGAFAEVLASDLSPEALELAEENARALGAVVALRQGDLYAVLEADERVDVLVSNPPYVASEALETLGLEHEPRLALDGGPGGGTALLDRLVDGLVRHLTPGGLAFFEIGSDQGDWARRRHETTDGVELVELRRDLAGLNRIAVFRRTTTGDGDLT